MATVTTLAREEIHVHSLTLFAQKDVLAGRAVFTMMSKSTGTRFTYKVTEREFDDGRKVFFVSVLTHDSEGYTYMGMLDSKGFRSTKNSKISQNAASFKAFAWMWTCLQRQQNILGVVEVWHEGQCLKCGRALTDPESIESGYGPVCSKNLGME